MNRNLGQTPLRKRRAGDPMRAFDALPAPLRRWLADAARPWSPASCRRIWQRAKARGETVDTVLQRLDRAEARTLARELSHTRAGASLPCRDTPGQSALPLGQ